MPSFDTPEPISAVIDVGTGSVRIVAGDRADTVVDVRPADPTDDSDVSAAEQTRVDLSGGRLTVRVSKNIGKSWWWGWGGSVDVTVELPAGSSVDVDADAEVRALGRLGECRISTSMGDVDLDETARLQLKTGDGDVFVTRVNGDADVVTANGDIRIREIDGTAKVKTSNGDITLGRVTRDARLNTASGDIHIDQALSGVAARTAAGDVRLSEVVCGAVVIDTGTGELEVGIKKGTAAWLNANSQYGDVRVTLDAYDGPDEADDLVEVHATTAYGDILVRHSRP